MAFLDQTDFDLKQSTHLSISPQTYAHILYEVERDPSGENAAEQVLMHDSVFVDRKFCDICNDCYGSVCIIYK